MAILTGILNSLLVLLSLFLICLVLIQRGKGGGLAGAFGGVGGSSAFGTKAGDVFTRVTIIVAAVWFSLTLLLIVLSNQPDDLRLGRRALADGDQAARPPRPRPAGDPQRVDLAADEARDRSPRTTPPAAPVSVPAIPSDPLPSSAPAGKTP